MQAVEVTDMYLAQFERLRVQGQGASRLNFCCVLLLE